MPTHTHTHTQAFILPYLLCHFLLCCILYTPGSLQQPSFLISTHILFLFLPAFLPLLVQRCYFSLFIPPFPHTYLSQLRHSLFSLCLFHQFAVIHSLRRKGRMASSWNGKVDDFGNTTRSAKTHMHTHTHTHTHTQITCRLCQSFSGLLCYTSSPVVGMNICLHAATLVGVCVRARPRAFARVPCAYVSSTPPCDVLYHSACMCPFKQGQAAGRFRFEGL